MATQPQNTQNPDAKMIVSYLTIRKAVGYLGIAFPIILAIGIKVIGHCTCFKDSLSSYYYTVMSSYFSGTLCSIALFLFTYRGYDRADQLVSNIGALFCLCVVFFPSDIGGSCLNCAVLSRAPDPFADTVHFITAGLFFVTMAGMSLFLFTKTDGEPTPQKLKRNKVYKICAWVMVISMALIPALKIPGIPDWFFALKPQFLLESFILWAFGISWLVKGEGILQDK
ncbi:MAG TPA: hypothetical protein VGN20_09905 [Mucilaginibacter sp.]|jgi:hypothetical protein